MAHVLKKYRFIGFVVLVSLVLSCSPIEKIETETLQPAQISFPEYFHRVAFLFTLPENQFKLIEQDIFKNNVLDELKYGIAKITNNTPRFSPDNILLVNRNELGYINDVDSLTTVDLMRIADSLRIDGIIVLKDFSLDHQLERKINLNYASQDEYYLKFTIVSRAEWDIFAPQKLAFVDTFSYKEKYVWEAIGANKNDAILRLPDYQESFLEAAYWTGYDYAERIFPVWEKNYREVYVTGNKIMRRAREKVENNNWKTAIELWKKNLDHYDEELVSRSAYNIAIAMEMLGEIDLALKWSKKAHDINAKKRAMEYHEVLEERQQELKKLEKQLP